MDQVKEFEPMKKLTDVDVAIIGAGTAGLSACREVAKKTKRFVIIHDGPHGTTCARVGCMPSKVFIQIANDFHRRKVLQSEGISGGETLKVSLPEAMKHVRKLRDRFVGGVLKTIDELGDHLITGRAQFVEPGVLEVGGKNEIRAKKIILATGSQAILPKGWDQPDEQVLTTDTFFEQKDFHKNMAVIGMGVIGLELGQAMSRLGIHVSGVVGSRRFIGGLTDPEVNEYALQTIREEIELDIGNRTSVEKTSKSLEIQFQGQTKNVDQVLSAMGRRANLQNLNLEAAGIQLHPNGIPSYNSQTMKIENHPVFIAGDVNAEKPILHEASDEGRIAGLNSVKEEGAPLSAFQRRTPLAITFSDPNIAIIGKSFKDLKDREIVIGEVRFDGQGRSLVMSKNKGILRVYADPHSGLLLGSELFAPSGEHLAHLLAWAIEQNLTVFDVLSFPFYHPVVEEGLRTAIRSAASQVKIKKPSLEIKETSLHLAEGKR